MTDWFTFLRAFGVVIWIFIVFVWAFMVILKLFRQESQLTLYGWSGFSTLDLKSELPFNLFCIHAAFACWTPLKYIVNRIYLEYFIDIHKKLCTSNCNFNTFVLWRGRLSDTHQVQHWMVSIISTSGCLWPSNSDVPRSSLLISALARDFLSLSFASNIKHEPYWCK